MTRVAGCIGSGLGLLAVVLALGPARTHAAAGGKNTILPPPSFSPDVLELFSKDARTLLGPGQPGGARPAAPAGGLAAPAGGGDAVTVAAGAWSKMISAENLEALVKAEAPLAADAVKTITGFKGNGREKAQESFAVLTSMFGVIARYDGDVRWKKDSLALEELCSKIVHACKTSSDAAYRQTQKGANDVAELIRGGSVADLPKPDPDATWGKLLHRPALMKRMETLRSGERLGKYLNKSEFAKNKDAALRDAELLTVFSEIIKDAAFESGDDDTYQGYAKEFQKQCLEMVDAIKLGNADAAASALSRVSKACDTCHGDFR